MARITNPVVEGYYADPEARRYNGKYYIYVTRSFSEYKKQMNLDCFETEDFVTYKKHESIIDMSGFPHIFQSTWAPTIIDKDGMYYLVFASNDIHSNEEAGGLEIAVSDSPSGPFKKYIEGQLVGEFHNGAQPIDAHLFKDDDGRIYLYYGGWSHCNVAVLNDSLTGFVPFETGEIFKEITPEGYVEGPCMIKKNGKYFFMWSSGNWTDGSYRVSYAVAENPIGPFENPETILQAQPPIAEGPGHHGYLYDAQKGEWLIVYHRRYIGDKEAGNRVLCIDKLKFSKGKIQPVIMTNSFEY